MGRTPRQTAAATANDESYYLGCAETLDELPERVVRYRLSDLTIVYCNVAWAAGHDLRPDEAIGRPLDDILTRAELTGLRSQLARLGPDNPRIADDTPRAAPNAPGEWVEWVDQYLPGRGSGGPEVLAVGRDVSGRHIAELNLAASESRFRELADKSSDVVWRFVLEPHPHLDYLSPSVEQVLGYPPEYFIEDFTRFLDILDDDTRAAVDRALDGELLPERMDFHFRHADGSTTIGEMQNTLLRDGLQGVGRDVTELRRLQADLAELALHDPLTGLANRRLFKELLEANLERARRNGQPLAVAFLDLNDFKFVNDTYGHEAGDTVLCETARRLRANVRGADNVARVGGDEFVIVYQASPEGSTHLLDRIDRALAAPIAVSADVTVECSASIGRADTNLVGYDADALLAAADTAMYEIKRTRCAQAGPAASAAG
jgi:diguanylate cyclase (GGDEF)-like protein/PAS domain S-box-containing protein